MKRISVIVLSIMIMYATIGSVLVFAAGNNNKVVVGALSDAKPYSVESKSEDDQILKYCIESIYGAKNIEYKYYSSYVDMLTNLGRGNIDIAFPVADYDSVAQEFGVELSNNLISADISLVYKGSYTERTLTSIAVDTNSINYYYAQSIFPESTKVFCSSMDDCIAAVEDGRASCMLVGDYTFSSYKNSIQENEELSVSNVPYTIGVCFAVKKGNTSLLESVNSVISNMDKSEISKRTQYIQDSEDSGIENKIEKIGIVGKIIIALVILLIIFGVIYVSVVASRKKAVQSRLNKQNQMLREAKMRQDEYNAAAKRRKEELKSLEKEISEKISKHMEEADKLKEQTEDLQLKNEDMQSQTDMLEHLLLEKYVQVEEFEKKIEGYSQQIDDYNQQLEDYAQLENYQKQLEKDITDKMEQLGYNNIEWENVDVRTAIKDILPEIKTLAETANVDFSLEVDEMQTPVVACDYDKLNKMILDMLFVAMRNSLPETKVSLNIHQVGEGGGLAYFDYTCIFTGDTLDYSSHITNNLQGVTKLQRMENGITSIIISVKLPIRRTLPWKAKH